MKLEFAEPGTFSYWIQGHHAGCVHPTEREEFVARCAWNAALEAAAKRIEQDIFQQPGPQDRHWDVIGTATRAVAAEVRKIKVAD